MARGVISQELERLKLKKCSERWLTEFVCEKGGRRKKEEGREGRSRRLFGQMNVEEEER